MKICSVCKKPTAHADMANRSAMCKMCHNIYMKQHYEDNKQYYKDKARERAIRVKGEQRALVIDYLRNHPCVDCGNDDIEVLHFDHKVSADKSKIVSQLIGGNLKRLLAEIAKCDVRCANCHLKRTRRQFGYWTVDSLTF